MKFSVVTISFNQAEFLERTMRSVLEQAGCEVEYIIVDPGSTDGSREIIENYRSQLAHVLLDPDKGPADGLNKGFERASGDILCYLNADDTLEPHAHAHVHEAFSQRTNVDVLCGHAYIIGRQNEKIRRVWSDPFERLPVAYGAATHIQPSTFIKREAYLRAGGFNVSNRSNWDGELLLDLYRSGARIEVLNAFLSNYRLHETSITNSGSHHLKIQEWGQRRFEILMGRRRRHSDKLVGLSLRIIRALRNPIAAYERAAKGPVYRRGVQ